MFKLIIITIFLFAIGSNFSQQEKKDSISVENLKARLLNDSDLVVLDVRTPEELAGPLGKIDKAINIPIQELEKRIDELKPFKDKEIAVICRSGVRSHKATLILNKNGFNAVNVSGGMIEYRRTEKDDN